MNNIQSQSIRTVKRGLPYFMKPKKKRSKILLELIAARKANREVERLLLGDGFHARTRIKKSKKLYCRKKKHPESPAF